MPRVLAKKKDYIIQDLSDYIRCEMKRKGISQEAIAHELKIEQPSFSYLLRTGRFSVQQIVVVFSVLGTDEEKIGRLLKV